MVMLDTFHKKLADAMTEAAKRKADLSSKDMMVRIETSPYGGYRVRSIPADLYIDQLADGPSFTPDRLHKGMALV